MGNPGQAGRQPTCASVSRISGESPHVLLWVTHKDMWSDRQALLVLAQERWDSCRQQEECETPELGETALLGWSQSGSLAAPQILPSYLPRKVPSSGVSRLPPRNGGLQSSWKAIGLE